MALKLSPVLTAILGLLLVANAWADEDDEDCSGPITQASETCAARIRGERPQEKWLLHITTNGGDSQIREETYPTLAQCEQGGYNLIYFGKVREYFCRPGATEYPNHDSTEIYTLRANDGRDLKVFATEKECDARKNQIQNSVCIPGRGVKPKR
jgi:hypothetical protein